MKQQKITIHWILGGALLLIGIFVVIIFILIRSQGAAPGTSLSVATAAPSVDTIKLCADSSSSPTACTHITTAVGVTLTSGSTGDFQIAGTLSDINGFADIINFEGALFNSSEAVNCTNVADGDTAAEQATCYFEDVTTTAGCTITGTSATAGYFDCNLALRYFATPTDDSSLAGEGGDPADNWSVRGVAYDNGGLTGQGTAVTEINSLRAIGTTTGNNCTTIAFGSLTNGEATVDSSASGTDCVLTNDGNVDTDVSVSGIDMGCTFGSVPIANQRVNVTSGSYSDMSAGGTDLTGDAQNINVALDHSTGTTVTESIYFAVSVPATGASGSCTGTNTVLAVSEL